MDVARYICQLFWYYHHYIFDCCILLVHCTILFCIKFIVIVMHIEMQSIVNSVVYCLID